jgi:hypothetical protein
MTANVVLMATLSVVVSGGGASHFVMPPGDPTADPAAVVLASGARFTVLADAVVRMEWKMPGDGWNDMQTMVVFNRRTRVPQFTHTPLPNGGKQVTHICVVTSTALHVHSNCILLSQQLTRDTFNCPWLRTCWPWAHVLGNLSALPSFEVHTHHFQIGVEPLCRQVMSE